MLQFTIIEGSCLEDLCKVNVMLFNKKFINILLPEIKSELKYHNHRIRKQDNAMLSFPYKPACRQTQIGRSQSILTRKLVYFHVQRNELKDQCTLYIDKFTDIIKSARYAYLTP
jgi:hypothetical protein